MIVVLTNDPDGFGKGDMLVIAHNVIAASVWRTGSDSNISIYDDPRISRCISATSRTAVYGPVRTVVWERRSREAPPIPIPRVRARQEWC